MLFFMYILGNLCTLDGFLTFYDVNVCVHLLIFFNIALLFFWKIFSLSKAVKNFYSGNKHETLFIMNSY